MAPVLNLPALEHSTMSPMRKNAGSMDVDDQQDTPVELPPIRTRSKSLCSGTVMIAVVVLLVLGLVLFNLAIEMSVLSCRLEVPVIQDFPCSPSAVNSSTVVFHSDHRYYSILKDMELPPPPTFHGDHNVLCNDSARNELGYSYCLPISGRKDTPFCSAADRMDLLTQHSSDTRCYASVLHLLFVEVYEELKAADKSPIVAFGSLLGAVRDKAMIPFTEDTDIAYSGDLGSDQELHRSLWEKGYHFFFLNIWRVCVAPTHPLAATLYDPNLPTTTLFSVPYVDLYAMHQQEDSEWTMEEMVRVNGSRTLPDDKVRPFSRVIINGLEFDTVHDPEFFLAEIYGDDYVTPKPRG